MRCNHCGHQNEPGANFCSRCGAPLGLPDAETTAIFAPVETEPEDEASLAELEPGQALLVVRRGPSAGTKFLLDRQAVSIGRHREADIFLDDITVSRRHAQIDRTEGGGFEVVDVGSLNGTYVNRVRVERAALSSGDELQIGKFRLLFLASPVRGKP
jgi:pSer/pThr/pTyr-binding forkhead associated (FHA) protein